MRKKGIITLLTFCITASMLSGCTTKKTESSTTKDNTEITTEGQITDGSEDATIQNTNINIGDYVTFGSYEQDNDTSNGAEAIKWQVVDISNGNALLVSNYILDNLEYNESEGVYGNGDSESNPWAQSYVYSWLNKDFAKTAFTEDELKIIVDTTDYTVTDEYGAFTGEQIGSVFLLSYDEAVKYFDLNNVTYNNNTGEEEQYSYSDNLLCKATPYAVNDRNIDAEIFTEDVLTDLTEKGFAYDSSVVGNRYSAYWLRSSLSWDSWFTAEGHALLVEENGSIALGVAKLENGKTRRHGIRPCVWVNLEEADIYLTVTDGTEEDWFTNVQSDDTEECTWEIDGNRLIITGTDKIPRDWENEDVPWYDSAALITEIEIIGVKKIPSDLFDGCTFLEKVILGDTVTRMHDSAFDNCPADLVIIYQGQEYTIGQIKNVLD